MSAVISVRVNDNEKAILDKASAAFNCKISSLIKKLTFEKLEDEYDMRVIREYEKEIENGTLELFGFDEVVKELKA